MKTILLLCVAFLFVGNITAQENSPLYKIIIENDGTYEEREIILYLDSETKEFITKKEFIKNTIAMNLESLKNSRYSDTERACI